MGGHRRPDRRQRRRATRPGGAGALRPPGRPRQQRRDGPSRRRGADRVVRGHRRAGLAAVARAHAHDGGERHARRAAHHAGAPLRPGRQRSSVTGPLVSSPGESAYSAAKAGLDGLTRALAVEAGPSGITVNSVAPGGSATGGSTGGELEAGRYTPVGRPGTPDEVAAAVAFLADPASAYVTGHSL